MTRPRFTLGDALDGPPLMAGDEVIVHPSGMTGDIRGWEIRGRRLETIVTYRVHLLRTPPRETIEVDARDLELRTSDPAGRTART